MDHCKVFVSPSCELKWSRINPFVMDAFGDVNMNTNESPKPRPYWHVDAKWISAILLLFLLSATFLTFMLVQITAAEQGVEILTVVLASSFSRDGLDQELDMEVINQMIAESPNGSWKPISGLNIVVREQDIAGLSPREIRLFYFRQMAEPLYYEGAQGLVNLSTDPGMQENMEGGMGPLSFINAETHTRLNNLFIVLSLVSLIFLGMLSYFSYRFGRLGSPGCVIFLAAVPGVVLFSMVRGWLEHGAQNEETKVTVMTEYTQVVTRLAVDILPNIVQKGLQTYLFLTLFGFGLMLAALISLLIVRLRKRQKT